MKRYPLQKDAFAVSAEPQPTTSILPFAREAVVGKTIHMCFEEEDAMYFYKGTISSHDEKTGVFHIDFYDGDEADITFVSGGDTILWETMDVTRDGQWPAEEKEGSDLEIVTQEEKEQDVKKVPGVKEEEMQHADVQIETPAPSIVDVIPVEKSPIPPVEKKEELQAKETTVKPKDIETNHTETMVDASVEKRPVPSAEKEEPKNRQVLTPRTTVGVKRKDRVAKEAAVDFKHVKVEKEDMVAKVPAKPDGLVAQEKEHAIELKKFINTYGTAFLDSLSKFQESLENLNTLSSMLKSYAEKEGSTAIQELEVPKTARGFLNTAFFGGKRYPVGIEHLWPMNDKLMKAICELYDVTTSLCQAAKFGTPKEPGFMTQWKKEGQPPAVAPAKQPSDVKHVPKEIKKEPLKGPVKSSTSMKSEHDVEAMECTRKSDYGLFPSTGNLYRDNAVRIFSQSLMSPATPFEIAVEMEQAIFSKCDLHDKGQALPDDYYVAVKSLWEVLNPASAHCNPLLRIMLLQGYMTTNELVSLREDDLLKVQERFTSQIKNSDWLRDSFKRQ